MERKSFTYETRADVEFTSGEVQKLHELSLKHYDPVCRGATMRGNFFYGAVNRYLGPDSKVGVSLTSHELQILGKIAEAENNYAQAGGRPVLGELGWALRRILDDVHAEARRLNTEE